jgi:hypothetical protein
MFPVRKYRRQVDEKKFIFFRVVKVEDKMSEGVVTVVVVDPSCGMTSRGRERRTKIFFSFFFPIFFSREFSSV